MAFTEGILPVNESELKIIHQDAKNHGIDSLKKDIIGENLSCIDEFKIKIHEKYQ